MSNFVAVCHVEDLPDRDPFAVEVHGYRVALFVVDDEVFALWSRCPHAGGPLDEGYVKEGVVACPWHSSMFQIATGECLSGPCTKGATVFPVSITEEGDVLVGPPPAGTDPPPPSFLSLGGSV